nr:uncharacterized protein LOC129420326 isoform X2 [Misgurnus anguillicaudatus]
MVLGDCCSDYMQTCSLVSVNGTVSPVSTNPYSTPTPPVMTSYSGLTTASQTTEVDPCSNYNILDDLWRSTSNQDPSQIMCDMNVNWAGWYRLIIQGESVQMPDTCVPALRCGTHAPLWLSGGHPTVEDGVVTRDVCGHWSGDCCRFHSNPIRVKACPDNYYVYKFVSPTACYLAYCADTTGIITTPTSIIETTTVPTTLSYDPCYQYNTIDEYWRDIRLNPYQDYGHDDTTVEWNGWYRLYLNGTNAQMSEWCVSYVGCGGETGLYLSGSHPRIEDGVVTREVLGSNIWWSYYNQCGQYRSNPIQVKACPGDYYVYKLVTPDVSISRPSYCAVAFSSNINDPCYNYESLDRPWRATTESGLYICDGDFSWNGWYRLYHYGMNIQMTETCVNNIYRCNTYLSLLLRGHHPQIEDGVVIREICGSSDWSCCDMKSKPIRVKACPGDYYVYELVKPIDCSGYCTDTSTVSQTNFTTPAVIPGSSFTLSDPCTNYNILDEYWRNTHDWHLYGWMSNHDDTRVKWDGWYRLFINGSSAQMPDWCVSNMKCGGVSSLWLAGSHPGVEDGVVTREVHGSYYQQCSHYTSNPIQVKACPGDYYVYKLTKPNIGIPLPSYCAVVFSTPRVDPCDNYTSLDEPWRSTDNYYYNVMCDYNVNWNGWYRLFINGQSAQMSESCVGQGMCGTYYTLSLRDPHPQLEDGVVRRHVCMSGWNGCCVYESHPIQVKACPGNYYVYEFVRSFECSAYCAASNTTATKSTPPRITTTAKRDPCSALNCTNDEWCGEMNSVYGCLCNENQTRSDPDSFDFFETCESSTGNISISRCQLFEAGFSAHALHLNDPSCRGIIQNGRVEFSFDNNGHTCGTNLMANGTHIIYENFILGAPGSSEGLISRERILQISFSCVYPQTQTLSMIEINPLESRVNKNLVGQGMYQVRMIPYHDVGFSQPFNGSVNAELNQQIFVEVRVDGVDSRQLVTVIDTCWATPVNDPDYSLRWDLITGECPNPHDNTVKLLQNGNSTSSRFSFRMFIFNSNSTKVYLHCAVHLCILANNHCSAHCGSGYHQRVGRSLDFRDSSSISMGPFVWSDGNAEKWAPEFARVSGAPGLYGCLMILLVSLLSACTIF